MTLSAVDRQSERHGTMTRYNVTIYSTSDTIVFLTNYDTLSEAEAELVGKGFDYRQTVPITGDRVYHRPVRLIGETVTPGARGVIRELKPNV